MTASIDPFHAIALSRRAHQLKAEGRSIIAMHFGQPSTGAPAAAIAMAHHVLDADPMGYWESDALKARIVRHMAETQAVALQPEQIILTCGASPALVMALTTRFAPGDRVAIARPGYVAYRNSLKTLHMVPVEIPCGPAERYQLTAAAIAALAPAPQGVLIASPANPTGTIIAESDLAAIAAVCRARGITIISDEIYHGLHFEAPAASILRFEPTALVINSFSKYWSMVGWRLGWLVVPENDIEAARARMGSLFLTPPSLSQHAALVAMDCAPELEGHRATYARNRQLLLAALPSLGLSEIAPPDGAFYLYANVAHLTDDSQVLAHRILEETGVALAPGRDFDPIDGPRHLRFSFAASTADVAEAIT
ncbi:aminotransferase [Polymorphobacter multimanifer]|uniref:aminotransferase class I/II-fold pyridoxal phosphate-dependent enzyme n=1 Tax=Polymorphobacter multimanifer TaxID=1070431 RepID=UPI001662FEF2|nr:aminotransferase class I/II-fold pyridoxal phosphate-dependent enzyme [Polymorphobacter multimanifer]GGI69734.1 aminotransferase [Polymorphobacter multimanifer]